MGAYDFLLGAKPIQLPDPLQQAGSLMTLANAARQGQLAQYTLQQAQRRDAAAQDLQRALPGLDLTDDNSVRAAMQQYPQAAQDILAKALDYRKNAATVGKDQASAAASRARALTENLSAASGLAADAARNGTDPMIVQQSAKNMGLDPSMFAVPDGQDPRQFYAHLAMSGISSAQQATLEGAAQQRSETARHNTATEGATAARDAATAGYQQGELAARQQQARIAAAQADPFGILGINNGQQAVPQAPTAAPIVPPGTGTTPGPNGPVVTPDAQAQRNQGRLALLMQERDAQAKSGQVDPALDAEIAATQKTIASGNPFAGGQASGPVAPSFQNAGPTSIRDAMAAGLHGDDFLKVLPPAVASQVKMLAEGKMQVPAGASLRNPQINQLIQLAAQYDPTFDAVDYQTRYKTAQDFAPQGKSGQNITALNTAMGHLAGLKTAMDKLNNFGGAGTPLNAPINAIEQYFGDPRQTDVAMHANAVAGELAKVFRSTGMSEADINSWKSQLSQNLSPEQQAQVVKSGIDLMNSRLEAIGDAYTRGMGKVSNGVDLLSPDAQKAYAALTGGEKPPAKAQTPQQRAAQGSQPAQPITPSRRNDLVAQAMDAISKDAPREKVLARLQQMGVTDAKL